MVTVISLGGSIVAPDAVDIPFMRELLQLFRDYLSEDESRKLVLIVGGGGPARAYQEAYRDLLRIPNSEDQDWIGIMATRLNAELVRASLGELCSKKVVTNPSVEIDFDGRVLVAAGWKPGFSTDFDAVILAERFKADTILNLSNISKVYSSDPKKDENAVPLDSLSWDDFKKLVGEEWTPGKNLPFDPIATKKAAELGLKVIVASGRELNNLKNILEDKEYEGTTIA